MVSANRGFEQLAPGVLFATPELLFAGRDVLFATPGLL